MPLDLPMLTITVLGALIAGFTTGFAGFGTGLVSAGLWFHALPAAWVPPLVTLASVTGQLIALASVRRAFDWRRAAPYLAGGVLGVPVGVVALAAASPFLLRTAAGLFLAVYAVHQLVQQRPGHIGDWGGRPADGAVGAFGGFLGGFAGLSGPPPLIWLRLRGGDVDGQRAVYQPFNVVVLTLAGIGMAASGQMTADVLWIGLTCLPATALGAWLGAHAYGAVSVPTFQRIVLGLLLVSGLILLAQALR